MGLVVGAFVFYRESKREQANMEHSLILVLASLFGGVIGSKIPVWIMNYHSIINNWPDLTPLISGRTIVGGLIGGLLATVWIRRKLHIRVKIGNPIAPAIALGMAIGRMGCFLRGCCYGRPTGLGWGVDFGDGILRHPTQLYDGLFNLLIFFYFMAIRRNVTEPGKLFDIYLIYYFSFRFMVEFWRQEPPVLWGLTAAQIVSLLIIAWANRKRLTDLLNKKEAQHEKRV